MTKQSEIGVIPKPDSFRYDTVLNSGKPSHHGDYFSIRHPKMSPGHRAKIFAPFAALRGFEEEVASKEVRYETKRELDPDELYELNHALNTLYLATRNGHAAKRNPVSASVEYYQVCEDPHNEVYGCKGEYLTLSGIVHRVDPEQQILIIDDSFIPFNLIYRIVII